MPPVRLLVLIALSLLVGCGSLGRLESRSPAREAQIRDYDRVIVADFIPNDSRPAKDEAQRAERAAEIEAGAKAFSARIAEEIRATGAFPEVAQAKMVSPALQVHGTVDLWEPGNIAARAVTGFVGKSEFSATVIISDLDSGQELARLVVDRNSWPLPIGASTTIVQTVDFFMHQAAKRVADELAKKKAPPMVE
ncbi:DUF4410 domain-containing protein [Arenimonas sp. MALMAid1274]|uniref:DUF4410 domain-containing protein n=1 Tax=Arenimonas sp. MALMAid1274 TaxID=3411630 RepID=UPI003B9E04AC